MYSVNSEQQFLVIYAILGLGNTRCLWVLLFMIIAIIIIITSIIVSILRLSWNPLNQEP